jgi:putative transcriptional regulator
MRVAPGRGRLLVAAPSLDDPNFTRTVVYLLDCSDEGTLGVVLNRPSGTAVDDIVPGWGDLASPPSVVFVGGPVGSSGALCLARRGRSVTASAVEDVADPLDGGFLDEPPPPPAGFRPLDESLGTADLHLSPGDVGVELAEARVFAGYAGWAAGQLDAELQASAWLVLPAFGEDVFGPEPETLWRRVLKREGGWLSVLARHPLDPSVN